MKIWQPSQQNDRGDRFVTVNRLVRFAAVAAVVVIAIIAIRETSRTDETGRTIAPAETTSNPLATALVRCREITAEQLAVDASCRRVWAENRRRFFTPNAPVTPTTTAPPKAQDRVSKSITPPASNGVR